MKDFIIRRDSLLPSLLVFSNLIISGVLSEDWRPPTLPVQVGKDKRKAIKGTFNQ
jgi:hypothetical protein